MCGALNIEPVRTKENMTKKIQNCLLILQRKKEARVRDCSLSSILILCAQQTVRDEE